jgi:oligosaccharyltransferase complex subunit delta (ribophorin II)
LTDELGRRLNAQSPLRKPISLSSDGSLKLSLTITENGKAKRPHQAFLTLNEEETGLEAPFPLTVKENGKGIVKLVRGATTGPRAHGTRCLTGG